MTGTKIRWDRREEGFVIPSIVRRERLPDGSELEVGGYVRCLDSDTAFAARELLMGVSLTSLRQAMGRAAAFYEQPTPSEPPSDRFTMLWAANAGSFDEDFSLAATQSLVYRSDGSLELDVMVSSDPNVAAYARDPEDFEPEPDVEDWLMGRNVALEWLKARGLDLRSFELAATIYDETRVWEARVPLPTRGRSVADADQIGVELITILEAIDRTGQLGVESVRTLLTAGHAGALLGHPEGQLLEAKRDLRYATELERHELAKDVAAFANSRTGGVVVFGLATSRRRGRDVIHKLHPFTPEGQDRSVRLAIDRLIFPPVDQLEVAFVPVDRSDEVVLMIVVPAQPPELRPFLVKGALVERKVCGNYIGLFSRRDDDVLSTTGEAIHSALAAGLALLRGEPR